MVETVNRSRIPIWLRIALQVCIALAAIAYFAPGKASTTNLFTDTTTVDETTVRSAPTTTPTTTEPPQTTEPPISCTVPYVAQPSGIDPLDSKDLPKGWTRTQTFIDDYCFGQSNQTIIIAIFCPNCSLASSGSNGSGAPGKQPSGSSGLPGESGGRPASGATAASGVTTGPNVPATGSTSHR